MAHHQLVLQLPGQPRLVVNQRSSHMVVGASTQPTYLPSAPLRHACSPMPQGAPVRAVFHPQAPHRRYVVRAGAYAPARSQPDDHAELIVYAKPGTIVFTTGRTQGSFVEVHNAHLRLGWMPLELLEKSSASGHHGDHHESAGGVIALLKAHKAAMLRVGFDSDVSRLQLTPVSDTFFTLTQPGQGYLRGDPQLHQAHVYTPKAVSDTAAPLPLLIMLHGSRPLEWDFASVTVMFQELANAYGFIALYPESHGPTWDYLLTGMREDLDFIQACVAKLCVNFAIDDKHIAIMGHSDGGSLGLSLVLHNPTMFSAALVYATGFFIEPSAGQVHARKPSIWLEYGKLDRLFGFESIAIPNCKKLESLGYEVEFRGVEGAGHMTPVEFFSDSIQFWLVEVAGQSKEVPISQKQQTEPLYRQYGIRGDRYVPACSHPAMDAEPICYQKPGAPIFTTGRVHGDFVEVHNAHGRCGWMEFAPLEPLVAAGRHGDRLERTGDVEMLLQKHREGMLCVKLAASVSRIQVQPHAHGLLALDRPGQPWLCGYPEGHRAHAWTPKALLNPGRRLPPPLLLMLHGSRPMDWDFSDFTAMFQEIANTYGIIVLIPESHGPTWDYLLTGMRDDMDFIQDCINHLRARFGVDDQCTAVMGHSDGGSLGLSMALRNPSIFSTALVYATGFFVEPSLVQSARPRIWLEYGKRDRLFSYEAVALPNKQRLESLGYSVQFRCKEDQGHMTHPSFFHDSVRFWLGGN